MRDEKVRVARVAGMQAARPPCRPRLGFLLSSPFSICLQECCKNLNTIPFVVTTIKNNNDV
jgi:hypothetical protein